MESAFADNPSSRSARSRAASENGRGIGGEGRGMRGRGNGRQSALASSIAFASAETLPRGVIHPVMGGMRSDAL